MRTSDCGNWNEGWKVWGHLVDGRREGRKKKSARPRRSEQGLEKGTDRESAGESREWECGWREGLRGKLWHSGNASFHFDSSDSVWLWKVLISIWFVLCYSNKTKSLTLTPKGQGFRETNFIGLVNHYCQSKRILHDYILAEKRGPPHNPQWVWTWTLYGNSWWIWERNLNTMILISPPCLHRFFYRLVMNNKDYPVGEGKNIKDAKQNAAQLAWSALQEQSDWDSKVFDIFYSLYIIK